MKRYSQIQDAALDFIRDSEEGNMVSFINGAKWADEHPKEGLIDINKAIEYIATNMQCTGYTLQTKAKFIHNFRIAMEK